MSENCVVFSRLFVKIGDFRPIGELIKLPESPTLEYKSTLQWDVRQERKNEDLRLSVLKTIAAFLNCDGGTLIIGVEDNGNIFGLEKDLSLLSKKNLDQFETDNHQSHLRPYWRQLYPTS